jgi:hypothetical protein
MLWVRWYFFIVRLPKSKKGTLLADRHRECDLPLSRAVDLVYQKWASILSWAEAEC